MLDKLEICNAQLNIPNGKLLSIVRKLGEILKDTEYLQQVLDINRYINMIAANN